MGEKKVSSEYDRINPSLINNTNIEHIYEIQQSSTWGTKNGCGLTSCFSML